MLLTTQIGSDEHFEFQFKDSLGSFFDLTPFTRFVLTFGGETVDSDSEPSVFSVDGEVLSLYLGRSHITITTTGFISLVGYSPHYTNGITLLDKYSDSPVHVTFNDAQDNPPVVTGTKSSPVDGDMFYLRDSEDSYRIKSITWAELITAIEDKLP